MHDDHIEGQLRAALRDAGGSLSVTITTAELERRLAARRRAANGRRLSFLAAGVAAIAIGSMVAASNGWLSLPAVGVVGATPSPSPSTSASLAALPVASPTNEPIASRQPLGRPDQAILVRATGDPLHPDGFEVTRFDPITAKSEVVATIPWSVLPGRHPRRRRRQADDQRDRLACDPVQSDRECRRPTSVVSHRGRHRSDDETLDPGWVRPQRLER